MFLGVVLWERLNEEVETEPEAPTVVIKSHRKNQRHHKQVHEDVLVIGADNQEEKEADDQDHELRRDDIGEDRAYEEAVFALEERHAVWAVVADVEWLRDDPRRAAGRTAQFQGSRQHLLNLFKVYFQGCAKDFHAKAQRSQRRKGPPEPLDQPLRLCAFAPLR